MAALLPWLNRRQGGMRPMFGDTDAVQRVIYQSLSPHKAWNDANHSMNAGSAHGGVYNLEFSPDGSILVAACEKKSIVLFDPITEKQMCAIENAHANSVNCVKFLDHRMFATCSDDTTVALWDTRNLRSKMRILQGHSNWVKNVEYSKKDCLLVTSGFDGSIFTWDINSYTEQGFLYQKVFDTPGLMRCRLTPDEDRLVICTTGGYLIIIHNLNLSSLARDLRGFRPNIYRLMQLRQQMIPNAARYAHAFSRLQHRNRLELVADFPEANDAEVISSLQIHPQGWCALSRNMSYEESSEWSCIHDIQELDVPHVDDDRADPEGHSSSSSNPIDGQENADVSSSDTGRAIPGTSRSYMRVTNRDAPYALGISIANTSSASASNSSSGGIDASSSSSSSLTSSLSSLSSTASTSAGSPFRAATIATSDIWTAEISLRNRNHRIENGPSLDTSNVYSIASGLTGYEALDRHTSTNVNRMLYYIEEQNKGKKFIKESCFSPDGRVICSPHENGIRLLAFNERCSELPFMTERTEAPRELTVIKTKRCHSDIVVSTKFSPRFPTLVSGCLLGKIVWYEPVL